MKLIGVMFDQPTITITLRALGLPVRAPPIAPARSRHLLDCSNGNDWAGVDVDYGWPDERRPLPHPKKLKTPALGSVIDTGRGQRVFAVFTPFIPDRTGIWAGCTEKKAKPGKSTDTARRKGGVVKADRGGLLALWDQ